jgi:hypothetical protein
MAKDIAMAVDSTPIGQRYEILNLLGTGGMGSIYRAYDRLSGQTVALKRVAVASLPATDTSSLLLALAQEFRLLASLRHPHIISVFDYGFDSARQPYFIMELLNQPQTLLDIGKAQPLLQESTRRADIVARYGGEEFIILLPETLLEDAQRSCERIRTQVEHYAWHKIDHNPHVTVSLGVAHNLGHARPEDQIREADARLYVAKQSGKNRVIAN